MTTGYEGPRNGDIVEVKLTGRVVGRDVDDRVFVMLRHPRDGRQLIDLSFAADDVVILERADSE